MPDQVCVLSRSSLLLTCVGCLEIDEEQLDRSRWRSVGEEQVHTSPVSCFRIEQRFPTDTSSVPVTYSSGLPAFHGIYHNNATMIMTTQVTTR